MAKRERHLKCHLNSAFRRNVKMRFCISMLMLIFMFDSNAEQASSEKVVEYFWGGDSVRSKLVDELYAVKDKFKELDRKYECFNPHSRRYQKNSLQHFYGMIRNTAQGWIIGHRIMGCRLRKLNVPRPILAFLNFGWESYEVVRGDVGAYCRKTQNSKLSVFDNFSISLMGYIDETAKDIKAVYEGYDRNPKDCFKDFIPKSCRLIK